MGYDLSMPAAFKALQRSKPPEPNPANSTNAASLTQRPSPQHSAVVEPIRDDPTLHHSEISHSDEESFSVVSSSQNTSIQTVGIAQPVATPKSNGILPHARAVASRGILSRGPSGSTVPRDTYRPNNDANDRETTRTSSLKFASAPEHGNGILEASANHKLMSFASTASFSSGVDQYGFKKPTSTALDFDFNQWSANYSNYMAQREQKWNSMLKAHGLSPETQGQIPVRFPPESQRLRRYVRKGIPPKWRGNAWFWFARGYDKLNSRPGLYEQYVKETAELKNSDTEHIERDLHRTFPDNIHFRNDPITNEESPHLMALRRVLRAFSAYQPKIGYCQSLNFIAGNLLLFMDEERAFWMLVIITQNYLAGLHEVNLEQVNISQGILMISVRDRLPKIWNALNLEQSFEENFISNLPPISLCTAPWFMSLMVNVLPTETMLRVWDCFFLEGPKTLYRISLTIFKLAEAQMGKATDELEVFQIIQSAPRVLYNPEVLMKACFKRTNGFGHISNEDIALLRSFVQSRRKQTTDGAEHALSDRHAYAKLHRGRRVRAKLSLYR